MAANFEASVKGAKSNIFLKFSNSLVSAFESFCVDMSSIKRKQKHSIDTPDDFESLAELSEGQDKFLQGITTLKAKVQLNEAPMNNICGGLTTLNHFKSVEVQSQLHDASWKVDEIESTILKQAKQIATMLEGVLFLERHSREYELRSTISRSVLAKIFARKPKWSMRNSSI